MSELCPCTSNQLYHECCGLYISGSHHAPTPGILMRSRYSAYVKRNVDYLIATWHPDCQAQQWRNNIIESAMHTEWLGLTVIEESMNGPDEGIVEFIARFRECGQNSVKILHERSRFCHRDSRWYYIDGTKPQIGRNAICPCLSGKKYKKCCGQ